MNGTHTGQMQTGKGGQERRGPAYSFPVAAMLKYHRRGGLKHRHLISHGSGSQKSKIKVSTGLAPSGGSEGESAPHLSPGVWWPLGILDAPWLVDTSLYAPAFT